MALAYLGPLTEGGPLSREAQLLTAMAQWNAGGMAAAIAGLDTLADTGDLVGLHAMFTKRDYTPEVGERAHLTSRMSRLHNQLTQRLTAFTAAHRSAPDGALEALIAEEAGATPTLTADIVEALHMDPLLTGLRRRRRSLRADEAALMQRSEAFVTSDAGKALASTLAIEGQALTLRCGQRILDLVKKETRALEAMRGQLRPPDIREQIFSPSYFTW